MALEMRALGDIRARYRSGAFVAFGCAHGVHTGVCTVGNFGSRDRLDYTTVGNNVTASRLETSAEANQIWISTTPTCWCAGHSP